MKHARASATLVACLLWAAPAWAQSTIAVDITRARLSWEWTPGTGGLVEAFRMQCGPTAGVYTLLVSVPDPAARSLALSAVVTTPGRYFCVVSAMNQFSESANSNEVSFTAGVGPVAPVDLSIQAQ